MTSSVEPTARASEQSCCVCRLLLPSHSIYSIAKQKRDWAWDHELGASGARSASGTAVSRALGAPGCLFHSSCVFSVAFLCVKQY